MTQLLEWQNADAHAIARLAARSLSEGLLVAFPTETVYGLAASALRADAVQALCQSKGRAENKPLTLALREAGDALDWAPGMNGVARRLARRCWPGPVTLVFAEGVDQGLAGRLPGPVRERVCPDSTIGLRVPAHEAILEVLRLLPGPLVLTSANKSGEPAAVTAEQVVEAVGDDVALVIDDGPTRFGHASTVVRIHGGGWTMLREGVMSEEVLRQQAACVVVFVCTGNTCRSPMAEALCKKLLAERLGCRVEELPARGFVVHSAGLAAMMGGAAEEAVVAARELGADLEGHRSRQLTAEVLAEADYLLTMTQGHLLALAEHTARLGARTRPLGGDEEDIPDPIGQDREVYRECARRIAHHLERWVAEFLR